MSQKQLASSLEKRWISPDTLQWNKYQMYERVNYLKKKDIEESYSDIEVKSLFKHKDKN